MGRSVLIIKLWCSLGILFLTFTMSSSVTAAENCQIIREAIERLYAPRLGTYSLWDLTNGSADIEQTFSDFILTQEDEVIMAGAQNNSTLIRPIITKMNRRGRILWTWMDKNPMGVSRPIRILELVKEKEGFLAVGQLYKGGVEDAIWFARFNYEGKKTSESILSEANNRYIYGGITPSINGAGFVVAVTQGRRSRDAVLAQSNAKFIILDKNLKKRSERSFIPGPQNKVRAIKEFTSAIGERYYIAAGEMDDGYGRVAGLVIRLDEYANVVWQRIYPRGAGLRFQDVASSQTGDIILIGDAQPIQEDIPTAAMAMKISSDSGTEIWQRYYMRDDISYSARSIVVDAYDRVMMVLQGEKDTGTQFQDHARLITLSPRGEILDESSYTAGKGVHPTKIRLENKKTFLLSGQVTLEVPDPDAPETKVKLSKQGWFVVGEGMGNYIDPCIIKQRAF